MTIRDGGVLCCRFRDESKLGVMGGAGVAVQARRWRRVTATITLPTAPPVRAVATSGNSSSPVAGSGVVRAIGWVVAGVGAVGAWVNVEMS